MPISGAVTAIIDGFNRFCAWHMSLATRVPACICPGNFVETSAHATPAPLPPLPLYVGTQDFLFFCQGKTGLLTVSPLSKKPRSYFVKVKVGLGRLALKYVTPRTPSILPEHVCICMCEWLIIKQYLEIFRLTKASLEYI